MKLNDDSGVSRQLRVVPSPRQRVLVHPDDCLQLHRNTSPLGYEPLERELLLRAAININLHQYPDLELLQEKLAALVGKPKGTINITSGVDGAIRDVMDVFCSPGDCITYLTPCYMMYRMYGKAYDLECAEISCDENLRYDFGHILEVIKAKKPKIFFLTNPHSPIDHSLNESEFSELINVTEANETIIFVDEAYHHFGAPSFIDFVSLCARVVIGRTFSKAYGLPSIRLGFIHANNAISDLLTSRRLAYETSAFSAQVALAAIENVSIVQEHIDRITKGRKFAKDALRRKGYSVHGENLNSLVITDLQEKDPIELLSTLEKNKIAVRCLPSPFDHLVNFTVGPKPTMKALLDFF